MRRFFSLLLCAVFAVLAVSVNAQNVTFTHENFPDNAQGLALAIEEIKEGERLLNTGESMLRNRVSEVRYNTGAQDYVRQGLSHFLTAHAFNPKSALLNYVIGKSYLYLNQPDECIEYITRSLALSALKETEYADLLLGQAYHLKGDFDNAVNHYESLLKSLRDLAEMDNVKRLIAQAKYAKTLMENPKTLQVSNMGPAVNTQAPEYLPISTDADKGVVFQRYENGRNSYYVSLKNGDSWGDAQFTEQHFNLSLRRPYLTKTLVDHNVQPLTTRLFYIDHPHGLRDYLYETLVNISPDGQTGYLTSSRIMYDANGNGSSLFETKLNANGKWTERPKSMGLKLNTQMDGYGIALHPGGKIMYFSSNGNETMGGFDIYMSVFDGNSWSAPRNMEYPVNSTYNDIVYSISEDGGTLFFTSNRAGGYGDYDLYTVKLEQLYVPSVTAQTDPEVEAAPEVQQPAEPKIQYPAAFRGFVTDEKTYKPLQGITVAINDKYLNQEELVETDEVGMFQTTLPTGASYEISIVEEGYEPFRETLPVGDERGQRISKYYKLTPLAVIPPVSTVAAADTDTVDTTSPESPATVVAAATTATTAATATADNIPPATDPNAPQVVLTAAPMATVDGQVRNETTGAALPAATVTLRDLTNGRETVVTADKNGYFSVPVEAGHPFSLTVSAPDYQATLLEMSSMETAATITKDIVLKSARPVTGTMAYATGTVTDAETGAGVPFTKIHYKNLATGKEQQILTDSRGNFKIAIPQGNPYSLAVEGKNYEMLQFKADRVTDEAIAFALTPVAPVTAVADVPEVTVAPPKDTIVAVAETVPATPETTVPTDTVPAVTETTPAEPVKPVESTEPVKPVEPVVPAAIVAYVDGHILSDETGQALPEVTITVKDLATGREETTTTDKNGYFKTSIAADQPCVLTVSAKGYQPHTAELTPLGEGQKTTRNAYLQPVVPAATTAFVKGTLLNEVTGQPLVFVPVTVKDLTAGKEETVVTNGKGDFITTIPDGHRYTITVQATGYEPVTTAEGTAAAAAREEIAGIRLTPLASAVTAEPTTPAATPEVTETPAVATVAADTPEDTIAFMNGTVLAEGKPVSAAKVTITDLVTGRETHTTTNSEGLFASTTPAYHAYSLTVTADGYDTFVSEMPSYGAGISMGTGVDLKRTVTAPALTAEVTEQQPKETVVEQQPEDTTKQPEDTAVAPVIPDTTTVIAPPVTPVKPAESLTAAATVTGKEKPATAATVTTATEKQPTKVAAAPARYDKLAFTIYFDLDRAGLTDSELKKIADIAGSMAAHPFLLIAYTDEVGGKGYNNRLSERRIAAIIAAMQVNGIPVETISTLLKYQSDKSTTSADLPVRRNDNHVEVWVSTRK